MAYIPLGSNPAIGSTAVSGLSLTTTYTITHSFGFTPSKVFICPTSQAAAANHFVSAKTGTTFTITFLTIPILGTNNITFDYIGFP